MSSEIVVAIFSLCGTVIGCLFSGKLSAYRIEKLENKVSDLTKQYHKTEAAFLELKTKFEIMVTPRA